MTERESGLDKDVKVSGGGVKDSQKVTYECEIENERGSR